MSITKSIKKKIKVVYDCLISEESSTPVPTLSCYKDLKDLSKMMWLLQGMPSPSISKSIGGSSWLLKKLSGDCKPKYMTPQELISSLSNLTVGEMCCEILWLSSVY